MVLVAWTINRLRMEKERIEWEKVCALVRVLLCVSFCVCDFVCVFVCCCVRVRLWLVRMEN